MIKNIITYRNKIILTIYHQGFADDKVTVKRTITEHIRKNRIVFTEEYVADDEWNNMTGYAWEENALLSPKEKYNPYNDEACANMIHRIYPDKPAVIWKKDSAAISEEELAEIVAFTKKYTGMNLKEYPVYFGDAFLFEPSEFKYNSNKENSVIIHGLKAGMRIIIHLKKQHNILQTKIVDVAKDTEELEITAECNWNNHDIEIYKNDKLIYIDRDISYMKCMYLNMNTAGRKKKIPLTALREYYELEKQGSVRRSIAGTPPKQVEEYINELNRVLVRKINNLQISDKFLFVRPGELDIAMKKITDTIFKAKDELWVIDAYFTNKKNNGRRQMTDWIRLIANSDAIHKNIIFHCNKEHDDLDAAQLKAHIKNDAVAYDAVKSGKNAGIQLIQTAKPIHDRFVIIRNGDEYSGINIGTSFNSLDENYYCINNLLHRDAKEIIETLCDWLKDNTSAGEECIYDK